MDFRRYVRDRLPPLAIAREPEIVDELAQHLHDLYHDARAEGRSAGVLLDEAGCRGLTVGGARFSEKHANFVENMGDASTADVVALMAEGRRRVRKRFEVELQPEVQFLGEVDARELFE